MTTTGDVVKRHENGMNTTITSYKGGYDENEYSVIWELQQQQQQQQQMMNRNAPPPPPPVSKLPHHGHLVDPRNAYQSREPSYQGAEPEDGPKYFELDSACDIPQDVAPGYNPQR